MSAPPFCGSIALRCRLSSRCSLFLVYDLSWLKRRVFPIASRLAPRPVMRHARRLPRALIMPCLPLIAIRLGSPTLLANRAASSDAPPNRHAMRGEERGEGRLLDGSVLYEFIQCYMLGILVICLVFLLYISYSCYMSSVLVIYLAFLLYISYSCYMSRILVISTCFVLYYFVEIMRLWAGAFN